MLFSHLAQPTPLISPGSLLEDFVVLFHSEEAGGKLRQTASMSRGLQDVLFHIILALCLSRVNTPTDLSHVLLGVRSVERDFTTSQG